MTEAHCNNLVKRKALGLVTHDNTGGPFVVECQGCGEVYPSFHCLGGEQIADTGDYDDARCPHCDQVDPEECDNAALAWNTQQLKINALQLMLNSRDDLDDQLTTLEQRRYAEQQAREAAERDAERYRWLRNGGESDMWLNNRLAAGRDNDDDPYHPYFEVMVGPELDAAIDAHLNPTAEPSALYRPALSIDGDQWCALYGADLQSGVAGFGKSPELAMLDFNRAWWKKLP